MKWLIPLFFLPLFSLGQKDVSFLLNKADALYQNKQYDSAAYYYETTFAAGTEAEPTLLYNAACSYALSGKKEKAILSLKSSVKNGFSDFDLLETDQDLVLLRKDSLWNFTLATLYETAAYAGTNFRGKNRFNGSFLILAAEIWSVAGFTENAFRDLEIVSKTGSIKLDELENNPALLKLHTDQRWQKLTSDIKLRLINERSNFYWGLYFGILCFLVVYNLFLFFSLKESSFLYYALFIFAYVQFEGFRTPALGVYITDLFVWFNYFKPASSLSMFTTLIALIFLLLFTKSFLNLKEVAPKSAKSIRYMLIAILIIIIISYFANILSKDVVFPMVLIIYFITFILGVYALFKKYRPARFFALGMFIMSFTVFWVIMASFDMVEQVSGISVFHIDNIGTLAFSVILSLAIGDKMNILKKEKESAQEKALEVLEEKVQERTREVVKQKHLIEEKQKEIIDSINYARRIQNSLIPTEKYIHKVLTRLKNKKEQ